LGVSRPILCFNRTNCRITETPHALQIEKNDKRVNEIIVALNNLIAQPQKTKKIGFNADNS
jgi:hypothetical protein